MTKKKEALNGVTERVEPTLLQRIQNTFAIEWTIASEDVVRPDPPGVDNVAYVLLIQGPDNNLWVAPSLYGFMGWAWQSVDDRSDDTIDDSQVVAWGRLNTES